MGNISTSHHNRGRDEEKHAIRIKGRENRKKERLCKHATCKSHQYILWGVSKPGFSKAGFFMLFRHSKIAKICFVDFPCLAPQAKIFGSKR